MIEPRESREYWPIPPPVIRPWPSTVMWRWRYELIVAALSFLLCYVGSRSLGWLRLVIVLVLVGLFIGVAAPVRRAATARIWCIATPHRVRTAMARSWVHDRRGRLPAVVWTSRTPQGEQVLLWCPVGVTSQHVAAAAEVIRSACLAASVEITVNPRYAPLVIVHIVRRP